MYLFSFYLKVQYTHNKLFHLRFQLRELHTYTLVPTHYTQQDIKYSQHFTRFPSTKKET